MMKWAWRPARDSPAITAPQPNSISSGCAPKARSGGSLEFGPGFIGALDFIASYKSNFRRFVGVKIGSFAKPGNVMRAVDHGLHPAESRVAGGRDLFPGKYHRRQRHERISA